MSLATANFDEAGLNTILLSRSSRFITNRVLYRPDLATDSIHQQISVLDFAPRYNSSWTSIFRSVLWRAVVTVVSWLPSSLVPYAVQGWGLLAPIGIRHSTFDVPADSSFAMHKTQPYLAYIDNSDTICVKNIYTGSRVSGPTVHPGTTPYPMVWISERIIEFSDVEGRILRWDFLTPHRNAQVVRRGILAPQRHGIETQLLAHSISPDTNWVLAHRLNIPIPQTPTWAHAELHDRSTWAATFYQLQNATTCATLLWLEKQVYIVHVSDGSGPYKYQLNVGALSLGHPPEYKIPALPLTPTSTANPQMVDIHALNPCGLILASFEKETHLFALPEDGRLCQIYPRNLAVRSDVLQQVALRLLLECDTEVLGDEKVFRKQLLSFSGHRAVALADLIQYALDTLPDLHSSRPQMVGLLQDICSTSGQLPSSYWIRGEIVIGRFIKHGGDAVLSSATLNVDGESQALAVRQVSLLDRDAWKTRAAKEVLAVIRREIVTHRQLNHPNIVRLLGIWQDQYYPVYMVLPLHSGEVLRHLKRSPSAQLFHSIARDMLAGLIYLHSRKPPVVHGDIHPGNILLGDNNEAILCDFGLSRIRHEVTRTRTIIQPGARRRYVAPELPDIMNPEIPFRSEETSDIYSLAMTLYHLRMLQPPFADLTEEEAWNAARRRERPVRSTWIGEADLWSLLSNMWDYRRSRRPHAVKVQDSISHIRFEDAN